MVAIRSGEADRFITRDVAGFALFLVHGPDSGLVSERVGALLKAVVDDPTDPFQLARLRGEDIAKDAPRLADEVQTVPLFGGKRAVYVDVGGKQVQDAVALCLEGPLSCPVVIEAGALKRDAPLRKLIERARNAAAIECYPDDERDLSRLIDRDIAAAGLSIEPDARVMLASLLGADRLASRAEIEKLVLYAHGAPSVAVEHVEEAVADASAQAADDALEAAFSGDLAGLDGAVRRLHLGATEAGQLLGTALRYAAALHKAKLAGPTESDAILGRAGFSPRRKAAMARQAAALGSDTLARAIMRLGEAIGLCRREPRLAESHAARALWAVAMAARPKPRS